MSKAYRSAKSGIDLESTRDKVETLSDVTADYTLRFIEAVAEDIDIDDSDRPPELIHLDENENGKQFLVEYSDDTRVAVGRDETSKNSGLFAFVPDSDHHPVTTVEQALDTLKPEPVLAAESSGAAVYRQGEWWFVQTDEEPEFSVSGKLSQKPFAPSPMENHVAREYGFGFNREELLRRLSLHASDGRTDDALKSIPRCFRDLQRENNRRWSSKYPGFAWEKLPEICGGLYVRGSVRHRDREHYMLQLGESWYLAYTHDKTVYQPNPITYGGGSISLVDASYVD